MSCTTLTEIKILYIHTPYWGHINYIFVARSQEQKLKCQNTLVIDFRSRDFCSIFWETLCFMYRHLILYIYAPSWGHVNDFFCCKVTRTKVEMSKYSGHWLYIKRFLPNILRILCFTDNKLNPHVPLYHKNNGNYWFLYQKVKGQTTLGRRWYRPLNFLGILCLSDLKLDTPLRH